MGTLFKRSNPDIDAYLKREDRARARRLEAFAIEALELGLAFEEPAARSQASDADLPEDVAPLMTPLDTR